MVGDDQHDRVVPRQGDEPPDLLVEELVVIDDGVLVPVPRLMKVMGRVHELPEGVVDPVDADLDEHEEVPGLPGDEPFHDLEPLLGHGVDLGEDLVPVLGPENDIKDVRAEPLLDLALEGGREGVLLARPRRGDEAGDHVAGDGVDRVARRDADQGAFPPCSPM